MKKISRRDFLSIAGGLTAFGLAGKGAFELIAKDEAHKTIGVNTSGKRWAMVIDLKKFKDNPDLLNKCINACHKAHNVPKIDNPKNEIKWIWKEQYNHAFIEQENYNLPWKTQQMPVLLLCNHCDSPPCTNVCPTQATWKREDGIVMMDWHRCIGCRYCMAACPYGSRSFNWIEPREHLNELEAEFPTRMKGVVEKCNFCNERVAKGEKPMCVSVCNNNEMIFGNLNNPDSEVRKVLADNFSIRRKPELGTHPEVYYLI